MLPFNFALLLNPTLINDMKKLKKIWGKPIYLLRQQPSLTDEMIKEAEKKIGYPLPKAYTDLLKIQNGGSVQCDIGDLTLLSIFGIGPNDRSITDNYLKESLNENRAALFPFDGDIDYLTTFDGYTKNLAFN